MNCKSATKAESITSEDFKKLQEADSDIDKYCARPSLSIMSSVDGIGKGSTTGKQNIIADVLSRN